MAVLPPDPVFSLRHITMGPVHSLCFFCPSYENESLLAGTQDGFVFTWNLKNNRHNNKLSVGKSPVLSIHHTSDSMYTQEKEGIVKVWSALPTGYVLQNTLSTDFCGFCHCQMSESNNMLILPVSNSRIQIMTLDGKDVLTLVPDSDSKLGEVMCFKFLELGNNHFILAAYESGDILLWDLKAQKIVSKIKLKDCPLTIDYDLSTGRGIYGNTTEFIQVFNMSKNDLTLSFKCDIPIKNPGVNVLRIRQDKKVFMSAGWDGRLRIFSWKSLRPLAVLTEHKASLQDVCHSGKNISLWNSPIMAAGGLDCSITLWDIYN